MSPRIHPGLDGRCADAARATDRGPRRVVAGAPLPLGRRFPPLRPLQRPERARVALAVAVTQAVTAKDACSRGAIGGVLARVHLLTLGVVREVVVRAIELRLVHRALPARRPLRHREAMRWPEGPQPTSTLRVL